MSRMYRAAYPYLRLGYVNSRRRAGKTIGSHLLESLCQCSCKKPEIVGFVGESWLTEIKNATAAGRRVIIREIYEKGFLEH